MVCLSQMTLFDGVLLGFVEGLTEFIPVSSTGHLILARAIFGLSPDNGLAVDAVLQLATLLAVLLYFRKDLWQLAHTFIRMLLGQVESVEHKMLFWALVLGTIPAVVFGLFLEDIMATTFRSPTLVGAMLIAGAGLFVLAEWIQQYYTKYGIVRTNVSVSTGIAIGFFQTLALIPGVSRSGAAISGGLMLGLSRVESARFAFLLAIPIIAGSGLKKFIELDATGALSALELPLLAGAVVACITGLFAIHFMLKFLKTNTLIPFALYRVIAGLLIIFLL